MIRYLLCLLCVVLGACASPHVKAPDIRFYTLEYAPPVQTSAPSRAVIAVNRFGAAPEFDTRKMIYRDKTFARQEYVYHRWRAEPQVLARDYLRRDMVRSGLFLAISEPRSIVPATHQLEGMVEQWMENDDPDQWTAVAELTITLLDLRARSLPQSVLFQRSYREQRLCDKKNPGAVAEAMSRVMRALSKRIIVDVSAAVNVAAESNTKK